MLVRMLVRKKGSRDGRFTENFDQGKVYDLSNAKDLAKVFVENGWATPADGAMPPAEKPVEDKTSTEVEKVPFVEDELFQMTVKQLKELADDLNVDTSDCGKKADIVKLLMEQNDG